MQVLVCIASLLFIFNKLLLLNSSWKIATRKKWALGLVAATLFIFYFFSIGSPMLAILEIGLTILTAYRTFADREPVGVADTSIIVCLGIVISILFFQTYAGYIETIQLLGALGMLIGTYCLIKEHPRAGFLLYASGHVFTTMYGYEKGEFIFWWLQLVQVCMCLTILIPEKNNCRETVLGILTLVMASIGISICFPWF